jgi:hypothetical protein
VTIRESLAELALITPGMVAEVSALARDLLSRRDQDGPEDAAAAEPPARKRRWFGRR